MLLLHLHIRMALCAQHDLVRLIDRRTLVRDTEDVMSAVTGGTGRGIFIAALESSAMDSSFELEGCFPVAPGTIDRPELLLVRQDRCVCVTIRAPQSLVD